MTRATDRSPNAQDTMADVMPNHRRHDDPPEGGEPPHHRLADIAESAVAKVGARIVTPTLLAITIALLTLIGKQVLEGQARSDARLDVLGGNVGQLSSDVRNINTRLDERVIRQVETNTDDIRDLKKRVGQLEASVRTP